jgi:hypothetical protein
MNPPNRMSLEAENLKNVIFGVDLQFPYPLFLTFFLPDFAEILDLRSLNIEIDSIRIF